jgi:hypothetical protein
MSYIVDYLKTEIGAEMIAQSLWNRELTKVYADKHPKLIRLQSRAFVAQISKGNGRSFLKSLPSTIRYSVVNSLLFDIGSEILDEYRNATM